MSIFTISAERWLKDKIKMSQHNQYAEFGDLTPDKAEVLQSINQENRSLSASTVNRYARDILDDRWSENGEPIIVSKDGFLNDGQHRCAAVMLAKKSIKTLFVFGLDHESRLTTNQGKSKTAGDYLGMQGIKNSNALAAIASLVLCIEKTGKTAQGGMRPSRGEVREEVLKNNKIENAFDVIKKHGKSSITRGYTITSVAYYFLSNKDERQAGIFMWKLITGLELKDKDPIYVAREKLINSYILNKNEQLKTIFSAWNMWREGRKVKFIIHQIKKGEKLPFIR